MKLDINEMRKAAGLPGLDKAPVKIIIDGDSFIVDGSWEEIWKRLGDSEQMWVRMVKKYGDFKIVVNDGQGERMSVDQFIDKVEMATFNAELDMGHTFTRS